MKTTQTLIGVLLSATLTMGVGPALADDRDYSTRGQLVLSFGSSPLVWLSELGLYVALGTRQPVFFHDAYYYRYDNNRWLRSRHVRGPWKRVTQKRLPKHLRNYRRADWARDQDRAHKRYRRDDGYRRPVPALRYNPGWHRPDDRPGYRDNRNTRRDLYRVPQPHQSEPRRYRDQRRPYLDERQHERREQRPEVRSKPDRGDRHAAPPPTRELRQTERGQQRNRPVEQRRDNRRNTTDQGGAERRANSAARGGTADGWWNIPE